MGKVGRYAFPVTTGRDSYFQALIDTAGQKVADLMGIPLAELTVPKLRDHVASELLRRYDEDKEAFRRDFQTNDDEYSIPTPGAVYAAVDPRWDREFIEELADKSLV